MVVRLWVWPQVQLACDPVVVQAGGEGMWWCAGLMWWCVGWRLCCWPQVQLACDAQGDAQKALELEPRNDYAHHLMGRWHYGEVGGMSGPGGASARMAAHQPHGPLAVR